VESVPGAKVDRLSHSPSDIGATGTCTDAEVRAGATQFFGDLHNTAFEVGANIHPWSTFNYDMSFP